MVHSFVDSYMLLFHLLRFLSGINIHYAACCGCRFVMLLIFTAMVDVKKKFNTEGSHEWWWGEDLVKGGHGILRYKGHIVCDNYPCQFVPLLCYFCGWSAQWAMLIQ